MSYDINYYKRYEPIDGKWYINRVLGSGAYGTVFEVQRKDFPEMKSAMKIISIPQSSSEVDAYRSDNYAMDEQSVTAYFYSFVEMFVEEIRFMSALKGHSNIVSYEDHDVRPHEDGIGWDILIRMELLTPMNQYYKQNPPTKDDIIRLGIDICKALEVCQKNKIIHRDIKPSNIFVSNTGEYKLGDFGVSRNLEKTSSALSKKGTYTYMAPEVYKGESYGTSVDIYSLGIVLYKLLNNGLEPLRANNTYSAGEQALEERFKGKKIPKPVNADNDLAAVVLKACEYNPAKRYSSPTEMREDLERILYAGVSGKKKGRAAAPVMAPIGAPMGAAMASPMNAQVASPMNAQAMNPDGTVMMPNTPYDPEATVLLNNMQRPAQAPAMQNPAMQQQMYPGAQYMPGAMPVQQMQGYAYPPMSAKKPKKKGKGVFAVFLIFLLLLGAAVGYILYDTYYGQGAGAGETNEEQPVGNDETDVPEIKGSGEEWVTVGYEEKYPFYAIKEKYIDGEPTGETEIDEQITQFMNDEVEFFYQTDIKGGYSYRQLYVNGEPIPYVEPADEMGETEWVIETYEEGSFKQYARKYVGGEPTEETKYTGYVYDHAYFVNMTDAGIMQKLLYLDGKPASSEIQEAFTEEDWVLESYEGGTYREYARKYVGGEPTEETKYTGFVYDAFEYTVYDEQQQKYFYVVYVNGEPTNDMTETAGPGLIEEEWVVETYEPGTYMEYARKYESGTPTEEIKYTGRIIKVEEWRVEGYSYSAPYYQYERKYINGERTDETRYTYPYVVNPNAGGQGSYSGNVSGRKYYERADGSIDYSLLTWERWYDETNYYKEYYVYYDNMGNEVARLPTGSYKLVVKPGRD